MFNVVLIEPEIPPNTGNIGRLCLATRSTLHLVKPLGFSLDDRQLRRAGLDYWDEVDVRLWDSFDALRRAQQSKARYFFLTTKSKPLLRSEVSARRFPRLRSRNERTPEGFARRQYGQLHHYPNARHAQPEPCHRSCNCAVRGSAPTTALIKNIATRRKSSQLN